VVSGGEDGYVRSWDLDAAATPDAATGHTGEVTDAVILRLGDRAAVVSSSADGAIQALDPDTGAALDLAWAPPDGGIRCLATTPFPAGPALLAGGLDGTLTAWDRAGQVLTAAAVRAHRRVLRAIGTATVSGRDVVITGGDDGVRTWDPTGWQPTGTAVDCDVRTLCTVDTGSRIVLVCGGDDGLRFWDLTAGRPIAGPALRWQQCRSVAGVRVGDRPMVVSGGEAGVQFWDPADGSPSGDPFAADQEVFTVAVVQLAGSPVLLWGDHEGLGIWSIRQHREIVRIKLGFPIRRVVACGSDAVIAVASHGVLRIDLDLAAHPSTGSGPTPRPAVALRRQR
jgi:WD40 repeat protein